VPELGNLMQGILLSLRRMSTVKIRARSLFCTPWSRIGAGAAGFGDQWAVDSGQWPVNESSPSSALLPTETLLATDH